MNRPLQSPALLLALLLLLPACSGDGETVETLGPVEGPIVVFAVEGVSAASLGAYGGEGGLTPALDALAGESLLFEWAFAQSPEALPSLTSALTGVYPATSGVTGPEDHLPHEAVTLAEALAESGYLTAAFVHGEETESDHGLAQGFERFVLSPDHASRARSWLEKNAGERFLLLVAGWPGLPEPAAEISDEEAAEAGSRASGEAYLRAVDAGVGEFLDDLRELGLDESATVAFVATTGAAPGAQGPSLRPESVHVPFLIRLPGGEKARSVRRVAEVAALTPTLIALAGAERPAAAQAADLLPMVTGMSNPPFMAFGQAPGETGEGYAAEGGYQLLVSAGGESAALFHLAEDPWGSVDLSSTQAQRARALRSHLEAWSQMVAVASLDPTQRSEEELDEATLEQLRSLGYIQ
jgi:arylsulfatase A-like enzyme